MNLHTQWKKILSNELEASYFTKLNDFIDNEYENKTVYPLKNDIFNAFNLTLFEDIKIVILGQDPYHGKGQGHGLAFSVQEGISFPPSLKNIFKEYNSDLVLELPLSGNLTPWAKEGVFLLNTVMSVRESEAHSHKNKGWERFTDAVIKEISDERENIVFILWGKPAQLKLKLIDKNKHLVLMAPHPSLLSSYRGFFGSKPFSKANAYLIEHNINPVNWKLD